jgi:predicted  nucleic acid-binding Zn-ribbon protein
MIIQEMEAEVIAHEACRAEHSKSAHLEERREELEDQLRYFQQRYKELTKKIEDSPKNGGQNGASAYEAERARVKRAVERIRGQLRAVDAEASKLEREIDRRFHSYWGSLLKEAHETSSFGDQVEEYACIYTSRVSNLLAYSPLQYFRSPRDLLPHEL